MLAPVSGPQPAADRGFAVEERTVRAPYPDVEHPIQRAYLLARKPSDVRS